MTQPIRHIVMWRVAPGPDRDAAIARIRTEFEGLRGQIPGMTQLEIGADISRISYACDVVLLTDFDSAEALRDYADHPAHLAARDRLEGLRIARHQVDYLRPRGPADA